MDFNSYIFFSIAGLINLILLMIVFFSKKRLMVYENKIYILLMFCSLFGIIIEIFMAFGVPILEQHVLVKEVVAKSFLVICELWIALLCIYTMIVTNKSTEKEKNIKRDRNILLFIYVILSVITCVLPIEYAYNETMTSWLYTYGLSTKTVFVVGIVYIIICLYYILKNKSERINKKYFPVYAYVFLSIIVSVLQQIDSSVLLISFTETIIMLLMYFTIENPDVKMIEKLEIAKEAADKANNAKTDFLSSMSHEIRTPLNAIVGFSDCIKESTTIEEAKENADDIISASNTLLEIVNGILDISKIEAGKLEIVNSNYDPKELFNSLAKLVTPKMNEKALDFHVSIAEDLPNCLYGDHANVKKVVTNILSNAYKYTDSGFVRYEVNCVNKNDVCRLVISVEDSGRGIKNEDVNKLFTKFQRVDEDRNTTIEGTGLGLAITKQLVELMGGNIIVHTIYGEGSKFTITLDQKISNVELNKDEDVDTIDLTGKTILVVDDNPLNLKVATKLLNSYNAEVVTSESGFDCISKIQEGNTYDLILLDDMMPKMRGTETFKKLKEDSNFKIPVIVLTANAITGMREKYLKDGFDDYLAKPIEKEAMIRAFSKIFSNSVTKKTKNDEIYNNRDFLEANDFDVSHGIELLGDMNMYNDTMTKFVKEMDKRLPKLEEYKKDSDMENYAIIVHAIKSDCKYLGIMSLADLAYEHELKSKDNDIEYINKNYDKLVEKIEDYVIICKKYLGID